MPHSMLMMVECVNDVRALLMWEEGFVEPWSRTRYRGSIAWLLGFNVQVINDLSCILYIHSRTLLRVSLSPR